MGQNDRPTINGQEMERVELSSKGTQIYINSEKMAELSWEKYNFPKQALDSGFRH
jgi:hypothetical protein